MLSINNIAEFVEFHTAHNLPNTWLTNLAHFRISHYTFINYNCMCSFTKTDFKNIIQQCTLHMSN